jgi:H+/Cl- antiporter ClcA
VEVLVVGGMLYEVLLPSFVAGLVGYQIALTLGVNYHHVVVEYLPHMSMLFFLKACVSGIFFGFCSLIFIEMLKFFRIAAKRINLRWQAKTLLGGHNGC